MSSIVTSILDSTVGLLWNKARDSTAAKLKDGDITDARIRETVVRELNDIKTKLAALSRKDLLSSYNFLQEGVDLLNIALNKSNLEQKASLEGTQYVETEIQSEALQLSNAIGKVKIYSDEEFDFARKRFKEARKTATHAFWNEALSINDRIFAAKIRIVSELLECLDHSETAITGCLSFLNKLHSLPAVQETFSVYLNGGVKAMLNKSERAENVKSVMLINFVLFQYVSKFSSNYFAAIAWPTIVLVNRIFHPIVNLLEISRRKSMEDELPSQQPNQLFLTEKIDPDYSAVNSHGDIILGEYSDNIKVVSKRGETKLVKLSVPTQDKVVKPQRIVDLAVDSNNNVYVVTWLQTRTKYNEDVEKYVLLVLDENYNEKHNCSLDFLGEKFVFWFRTAVTSINNLIMAKYSDNHVYVCDSTGKLKHKFERECGHLRSLNVSGENEVMILSDDIRAVQIYSEEGMLKSTIELPESEEVVGLAYHNVICKIIVLSYSAKSDTCVLRCYTERGVLETTMLVCKTEHNERAKITSHPSGPAVIVTEQSIEFI